MRKLLILVLISVLVFGCKKDEQVQNDEATQFELSFNADLIDPGATKDWLCKVDYAGVMIEPDYAAVKIDGNWYYPLVYRIDGNLYTQNIKLDIPPNGGSHVFTVEEFYLYKWVVAGTPDPTVDDLLMGTPVTGSDYAIYVEDPVTFEFTVSAFTKVEVDIDVLCYLDHLWQEFGFVWFNVDEIVIRKQCFFGDICVKHPTDYIGSDYENQSTGLQMDMPAIATLKVFRNGVEVEKSPFTNRTALANWGVGAPLCIEYPDYLYEVDNYDVELWILVKWGDSFVEKYFYTWSFTDGNMIPDGQDGIVEFVLGECNLMSTDLQLAPYQNLPSTVDMSITYPGNPGYWDLICSNEVPSCAVPATCYDLPIGVMLAGWCADHSQGIWSGTHACNVYPSLYDYNWPAGMPWGLTDIAKVNWLFNNLGQFGIDINAITVAQGLDLQDAIWNILQGYGTPNAMATAAATHGNYIPLPGGWAAAIFAKDNDPFYQLIITIVDP